MYKKKQICAITHKNKKYKTKFAYFIVMSIRKNKYKKYLQT